jgi:uncharacterized protein (TIGR03083 family)
MYRDGQHRITELLQALPAAAAKQVTTPGCPDWSVHDVVAHLAGVADDIIAGRLDGVATDAWTATQVNGRREVATADVLGEWEGTGDAFASMLDDFPGWFGVQAVMDLTVHEHDIRGALRAPGARDSEAVVSGLDMLMSAILHPVACLREVPPLLVRAASDGWVLGGEPPPSLDAGDPVAAALLSGSRPSPEGVTPAATLAASRFELFRAATGRRSEAQIRGYEWSADPAPYLALFSCGPFTVRDTDLVE